MRYVVICYESMADAVFDVFRAVGECRCRAFETMSDAVQ